MKTFEELGVSPEIRRAIEEMGYENPMPVQEEVIPYLLGENNDVVALAQTGTGKTAAFGLPLLQKTDVGRRVPQSLILCPTRELCLQIAGDLNDYSKYIDGLRVLPVYGGSSIESQIRALKNGVHIIVATPGRLIDLMERKTVSLATIENVVMDEADEMLNMGFTDSINAILAEVPQERNTLLFSATMSPEIARIAKNYLRDAKEITIGRKNEGTANVKHLVYVVHAKDKYAALKRIVDYLPEIYGIIFCRTRKETQEIADKLIQEGYNADALHGELSQAQRDLVMQKFRMRNLQLLVATDVAARGLDVDDLTHVINYGLPDDAAVYTHRSGRTGRAGKHGVSIAIIHSRERGRLREIEKIIGKEFEYRKVPTPEHIIEKQLYHLADRLERVEVNEDQIAEYLPGILKKLEWLSGEDLLKRLLTLEFHRLFNYYSDMPDIDLNADAKSRGSKAESREKKPRSRGEKDRRTAEEGMARIAVNVGKKQGFYPKNLMEMINRGVSGSKPDIGRIDLMPDYTLFDVRKEDARRINDALKGDDFFGTRLRPEIATDRDYSRGSRAETREKKGREPKTTRKAAKKAEKSAKAAKTSKKKKSKAEHDALYHGNYDIFMKK